MMEFFLSGSLPLIDFVICDVMSDMANKLLSLSLYRFFCGIGCRLKNEKRRGNYSEQMSVISSLIARRKSALMYL